MTSRGVFFLFGLWLGAIAGALLGFLLAPKKGEELRRDLAREGRRVQADARVFGDKATARADAFATRAGATLDQWLARVRAAWFAFREVPIRQGETESKALPPAVQH